MRTTAVLTAASSCHWNGPVLRHGSGTSIGLNDPYSQNHTLRLAKLPSYVRVLNTPKRLFTYALALGIRA